MHGAVCKNLARHVAIVAFHSIQTYPNQWKIPCLVAFICSLIGAVFLAAFGVWGCICAIDTRRDENRVVTSTQIPRSSLRGKVSTSLWSFVASLASIVLVAQASQWFFCFENSQGLQLACKPGFAILFISSVLARLPEPRGIRALPEMWCR
jgi:hypothetical protein